VEILLFRVDLSVHWTETEFFFFLKLFIGTLFNCSVVIPMIISSALVVVVAVTNRFPKLLIPWIVFSILELFIIPLGCYFFMVAVVQKIQPNTNEKFFFTTYGVPLLAGNITSNRLESHFQYLQNNNFIRILLLHTSCKLVTFWSYLFTAVILFRTWFVVFSYYHELMFGTKKYPAQPDDLPL
jgi:hypothetical protein